MKVNKRFNQMIDFVFENSKMLIEKFFTDLKHILWLSVAGDENLDSQLFDF